MPPKKKLRSEAVKIDAAWVAANDELISKEKVTISELFQQCKIPFFDEKIVDPVTKKVKSTGRSVGADWSALRKVLESRTVDSPCWFLHRRSEDLLLDPDGCIGEHVECFAIIETHGPSLAPRHYIIAVSLPDADLEDHVPERVLPLAEQGVKWYPVTKDDGTDINAFVIMRKCSVKFTFGAAPPAAPKTDAPVANASPAPAAGGFGFSFGATAQPTGAAAPATAGTFAFSFGASAPSSATPAPAAPAAPAAGFGFGFGNTPAPAAGKTDASSTPVQPAKAVTQIPVEDLLIAMWSPARVKEELKLAKSGSRIVLPNFSHPSLPKPITLVMQDDVKDTPAKAADEFILKKIFARQCHRVCDFDKWMDDCPEVDGALLEHLQKARAGILVKESRSEDHEEGETSFEELKKTLAPLIIAKFQEAVGRRRPLREDQVAFLTDIQKLLSEKKLVSKTECTLRKYYPANNEIKFRPYGKIAGITEDGEHAECVPPMYRFINPFAKK